MELKIKLIFLQLVYLGGGKVTLELIYVFCEESLECSSDLPVLI